MLQPHLLKFVEETSSRPLRTFITIWMFPTSDDITISAPATRELGTRYIIFFTLFIYVYSCRLSPGLVPFSFFLLPYYLFLFFFFFSSPSSSSSILPGRIEHLSHVVTLTHVFRSLTSTLQIRISLSTPPWGPVSPSTSTLLSDFCLLISINSTCKFLSTIN